MFSLERTEKNNLILIYIKHKRLYQYSSVWDFKSQTRSFRAILNLHFCAHIACEGFHLVFMQC